MLRPDGRITRQVVVIGNNLQGCADVMWVETDSTEAELVAGKHLKQAISIAKKHGWTNLMSMERDQATILAKRLSEVTAHLSTLPL